MSLYDKLAERCYPQSPLFTSEKLWEYASNDSYQQLLYHCDDGEKLLFYKLFPNYSLQRNYWPWPLALKIIQGSRNAALGTKGSTVPLCNFSLQAGGHLEIMNPNVWLSVEESKSMTYLVMLAGKPWVENKSPEPINNNIKKNLLKEFKHFLSM